MPSISSTSSAPLELDPSALREPVGLVIEPDTAARTRLQRALMAAVGLSNTIGVASLSDVDDEACSGLSVVVAGSQSVDETCRWLEQRAPFARLIICAQSVDSDTFTRLAASRAISSLVGWPAYASSPRTWEVGWAARLSFDPSSRFVPLSAFMHGSVAQYSVALTRSAEIAPACELVSGIAERCTNSTRLHGEIGLCVHELLMNAIYDAPVDGTGSHPYAHDRRAVVHLPEHESPTLSVATDGALLAVRVSDPFGLLERNVALGAIERGLRASKETREQHILDSTNGGAGLGLFTVFTTSASTWFEVEFGRRTDVTVFFDFDLTHRSKRLSTPSLHFFER